MIPCGLPAGPAYQALFQQRWGHLRNLHVRNLAWVIDAPALPQAGHAHWQQQLAPATEISAQLQAWLWQQECAPAALLQFLALHAHTRLGLYAENLLAWYFRWSAELLGHGVQVRSQQSGATLGEFDFLLQRQQGCEHWEFACKFYLLVPPAGQLAHYIGPNLIDNLEEKSRKIFQAQLRLGQHPEAQRYLQQPLTAARALLKGWLFYPPEHMTALAEINPAHCRGVWCRLSELLQLPGRQYAVLPRLAWLAPARVHTSQVLEVADLHQQLQRQFEHDARPVLAAQLSADGADWIEVGRVFIVPQDWNRAARASAAAVLFADTALIADVGADLD